MATTKYLDKSGLTYFWSKIKTWATATFAPKAHTHGVADISGTLPIAKGGTGATTAAAALKNMGVTATADTINNFDYRILDLDNKLTNQGVMLEDVRSTSSDNTLKLASKLTTYGVLGVADNSPEYKENQVGQLLVMVENNGSLDKTYGATLISANKIELFSADSYPETIEAHTQTDSLFGGGYTKIENLGTGTEPNLKYSAKINGVYVPIVDISGGTDEVFALVSQLDSKLASQNEQNQLALNMLYNGLNETIGTKAPLASPAFSGTPTVPTASTGTNTQQIASTAFVQNAVKAAIAGVSQMHFEVVTALPTTGDPSVIYLVSAGSDAGTGNSYYEYCWIASQNKFEKIGSADIDIKSITNAEIDTIVA